MSELGDLQDQFSQHAAKLILKAGEMGFGVRLGECLRSDEQAVVNALGYEGRMRLVALLETRPEFHGLALTIANNGRNNGILMSLHREKLAIDLNLVKDGKLCGPEDHRELSVWWKTQHRLAVAGYDFGDAGHYAFTFGGRK